MSKDIPAMMLNASQKFMAGELSPKQYHDQMRRYWTHGAMDYDDLAYLAQALIEKDAPPLEVTPMKAWHHSNF